MQAKQKEDSGLNLSSKSQAAMEYLMTYGWAILIIGLSLGVLYTLGVFNVKNFLPKSSPGSCYVYRPNGPGTSEMVTLQGTCGYLPMYIADFWNCSSCINTGYVPIVINNVGARLPSANALTITWWTWPNGCYGVNLHLDSANSVPGGRGIYCWPNGCNIPVTGVSAPSSAPNKAWSFDALVLNSNGQAIFYRNAQPGSPVNWAGPLVGVSNLYIFGYWPTCADLYKGRIANVQIYNAALTPQEIQQLYQQGIGAPPIRLRNLVGWWPLNGDAKDYSGNNLHGTIFGGLSFIQNYNPP